MVVSGTSTVLVWCAQTVRPQRISLWSSWSMAASPSVARMANICVETREARWKQMDSAWAAQLCGSINAEQTWNFPLLSQRWSIAGHHSRASIDALSKIELLRFRTVAHLQWGAASTWFCKRGCRENSARQQGERKCNEQLTIHTQPRKVLMKRTMLVDAWSQIGELVWLKICIFVFRFFCWTFQIAHHHFGALSLSSSDLMETKWCNGGVIQSTEYSEPGVSVRVNGGQLLELAW